MAKSTFVGRIDELRRLNLLLEKPSSSFVVIKGRRRIGKSRLIEEFARGKKFIRFSGISPTKGTTNQDQMDVFSRQISNQLDFPFLKATDWSDLFKILSKHTQTEPVVILFDEISWMGSEDPTFLGKLKNAWDMEFSKNPGLIFIVCGSVSTWIETNIIKNTGFFGRISAYFTLDELSIMECNELLTIRGFRGPAQEKLKILSLTGGIPWYIEQIIPSLSADDNIKNLCFIPEGLLVREFDLIFHDLFITRNETYKKIIEALSNGVLEFNDIVSKTKYPKSGVLASYLTDLILAGFVTRDYTWSLKTEKTGRLSHFRLSDNYLRFYLRHILENKDKIIGGSFKNTSLSLIPGWDSIMGFQFENLVLKNRSLIKKTLNINPSEIVVDNPYFQRKTSTQSGCQIDYLIQTARGLLFPCEVKFSRNLIKRDIIDTMTDKLKRLSIPKGCSLSPVLIHASEVDPFVIESRYFSHIIDFTEFLNPTIC